MVGTEALGLASVTEERAPDMNIDIPAAAAEDAPLSNPGSVQEVPATSPRPGTPSDLVEAAPHGGGLLRWAIIDSETTGLPPRGPKVPADHPTQPWLAHFAMILASGPELTVEREIDLYLRPDGWSMPPEASAVNGLTDEFLREHGHPVGEVLDEYERAIKDGYVVAAYNAEFDTRVMRGALRRAGRPDLFEQTPNVCIMRAFKEYRQIFKGYKLSDACTYFKIPYERLHRAPADARAAREVMLRLMALNAIPEAKVHYSKDHEAIVARAAVTPGTVTDVPNAVAHVTAGGSYRVIE